MKVYNKFFIISAIAFSVTACKSNLFSNHIACDDKEALILVNQVLKDDLNKALEVELKSLIAQSAIKDLDPAKLKLSAQNIAFSLADSRTEFIDPNSPKTTCSIDLSITLPSDLVKKSDEARAKVERMSTEAQAYDLGLDFESNKVNLTFEYTLQPTDKGDKIFALLKNTQNSNLLVSDTLTYAFLKPQIEKNQIKLKETKKRQELEAVNTNQVASDAAYEANLAAQEATVAAEEYYEDY